MKTLQILTTASLATGMLTLASGAAQAVVLIGNVAGVPSSFQFATTSITASGPGQIDQRKSVEFTTGSTPQYLTSVEVYLAGYDTADTPQITIFQGTSNAPVGGTTVTMINPPAPPPLPNGDPGVGANDVYEYTSFAPSPYTFLPNTQYTLIVGASVGAFNWVRDTQATNVTPTGSATFNAYRFSSGGAAFGGPSSLFNNFAINVTNDPPPATTPEPTAILGLLAVGLLGTASRFGKKAD